MLVSEMKDAPFLELLSFLGRLKLFDQGDLWYSDGTLCIAWKDYQFEEEGTIYHAIFNSYSNGNKVVKLIKMKLETWADGKGKSPVVDTRLWERSLYNESETEKTMGNA